MEVQQHLLQQLRTGHLFKFIMKKSILFLISLLIQINLVFADFGSCPFGDVQGGSGLDTSAADLVYARLDGANQPFSGNLQISKSTPTFTVLDSSTNYLSRLTDSQLYMTDQDLGSGYLAWSLGNWNVSPDGTSGINLTTSSMTFNNGNASSAGTDCVVQAQSATGAGNNTAGGNLILKPGSPHGNATSNTQIFATGGFSSGGTARTPFLVATFAYNTLTFIDAYNIAVNTTTGTKIGTATTQKLGFYNATPVAQQSATTDLGTALSNLGFRAAGTAYPITTSGPVVLTASSGGTTEGQIWNDSTQKTITAYESGLKQYISSSIFTQTQSVTVANTVTETALTGTGVGTLTLPANFLIAGKTIRITARGIHSATGSPTIQIKIKLGSTTILDTGANNSGTSTNTEFALDGIITCRTTGASGTLMGQGAYREDDVNANLFGMVNTATTTIDTTVSQAISVTAQWGTASSDNTITLTNLMVEILN